MELSGGADLQAAQHLDPLFLRTCRRETVEAAPVWLLNQAGLYLPEHRRLRENHSLLELYTDPDLSTEAALQPIRRFGFDACTVFTEPLIPALYMVADAQINGGIRVEDPVRHEKAVRNLRRPDPQEDLGFVLESIRNLRRELPPTVALIGLSAAPFTLAGVLVEGAMVSDCTRFKSLMYGDSVFFHALMEKASLAVADFLEAQIRQGAQAVQIVDPLAGCLTAGDYETYVLPHLKRVMEAVHVAGVPRMLQGGRSLSVLEVQARSGSEVLGVDWRLSLSRVRKAVGDRCVLHGNLDPDVLFAPPPTLQDRVRDILETGGPSHIFNLGQDLPSGASLEAVETLVTFAHQTGKKLHAAEPQPEADA